MEVDVQVALAVSRAAARAMMSLSPNAEGLVRQALAAEIEDLQSRSDPLSLAAASNLLELLDKAA